MRTPSDLMAEARRRDVHVRQYLDGRRFELFADGRFHSWWSTTDEVNSAVQKLLDITDDEYDGLVAELEKRTAA